MTLPATATKANLDSAADDPKLARAELADLVDKFNALLAHLGLSSITLTPLGVGQGLESEGVAPTAVLRAKVKANGGVARDGDGLALDVNGLTEEASIALGDFLALYDASATGMRKFSPVNLLKVLNLLTEQDSPNAAADFVLLYDTAAGTVKKTKVEDIAPPAGITAASVETFTSSGTSTKPTGARLVHVITIGGGGYNVSSIGGGGAAAESWLDATALGDTITVTIGAGANGISPANTGGDTSFGAHVIAKGGAVVNGGSASASTGQAKFDGVSGAAQTMPGCPGLLRGTAGRGGGTDAGTAGYCLVEWFV